MWREVMCALAVGSAVAATTVAAEPWRLTNPDSLFAGLDANKDGQIVADEVPKEKQRVFGQLLRFADKDRNQRLSKAELTAAIDAQAARLGDVKKTVTPTQMSPQFVIRRFDKNNDRKLQASEVPPAVRERFTKLLKSADKDGDGALDAREALAAAPLIAQIAKARKEKLAAKPAAKPKPAANADRELFRLIDSDGDGKLSDAEMKVAERVLNAIPRGK